MPQLGFHYTFLNHDSHRILKPVHDYSFFFVCKDVVLPEKPKLKFMNKVPNLKKVKKERKRLWDIQGPARAANTFTTGQYAIVVSPATVWNLLY